MKKLLLISALLIVGMYYSQSAATFENNELTTSTGYKVYKGLGLKIGTGTMDNGNFKFIRRNHSNSDEFINGSSLSNVTLYGVNSLDRSKSGLTFEVKKIMPRGSKKRGYVYYAKIGNGLLNYEVDIENAIKSGELIVPDEFLPKEKSQNINSETKYDKLKKIKELKDSGVLSEEEFQKEKDKIMTSK